MQPHLDSILLDQKNRIRQTFGSNITNHLSANLVTQPQDTLLKESRETVSVNNNTANNSLEFAGDP